MKRKGRFDGIIVETTGLADPAPVAQTFFVDEDVRARAALDAIVTVVDAKFGAQRLDDSPEAKEQAAFADVLVLNKLDLATPEEAANLERRLRGLNPYARIVRAERAQVPLDAILGLGAFDLDRILTLEPQFLGGGHDHDHHHHGHDHGHDHHHDHAHHDHGEAGTTYVLKGDHDDTIGSVSLALERPLDGARFLKWFQDVLATQGADILRAKGILAFRGEGSRFVVQAVHMISEGDLRDPWGDRPRTSRLVFIGRKLDAAALKAGFEACAA